MSENNSKEFNFEESINELETLISKSEQGGINLDDMVKNYQRGVKILSNCRKKLESAELEIRDASILNPKTPEQDA